MYIALIDAFGWDTFKTIFKGYLDRPFLEPPSDASKRDRWLIELSIATRMNMGPFFEAWRVPTSGDARALVSGLPPFEWHTPTAAECQAPPQCP